MIKLPLAQYINGEIEAYKNNPLINALPPIFSKEKIAKALFLSPKISDLDRKLPSHLRRHAMMSILDEFLYPTSQHLHLEQTISALIRRSYSSRNIATSEYDRLVHQTNFSSLVLPQRKTTNSSFASSVIGCSGTGKSTAVEAILRTYPQAMYHPEYQHTQLVWLKLDSPHDGSAKSLCIHFFRGVDSVLGTKYEGTYVKSRASADSMLTDIARVSTVHSLGILVLDELQHLQAAKSGGYEKLLNFFVTMSNVIKIPVLFVGTPKALGMVGNEMRAARRLMQIGHIYWNRFQCINKKTKQGDKGDIEWRSFLERMWKLQWFENPTLLTDELDLIFRRHSQGIVHFATLLFYLAQVRAVINDKEVITPQLIDDIFKTEMRPIHPMINAIKLGREEEIDKFDDLDQLNSISSIYSSQIQSQAKQIVLPETDNYSEIKSKEEQLIQMLIIGGISEKSACVAARQAIKTYPDADLLTLISNVQSLEDDTQPSLGKPKTAKLVPCYVDNDLRVIGDSDDPYESFKKAGLILDVSRYLN